MSSQPTIKTTAPVKAILIAKRVSRKPWKLAKTATKRTQMPKSLQRTWDQRIKERKEREMVMKLQKEMKDEKNADKERKRTITQERRKQKEEKERLEMLAAKMSAKRIARLRKKQGKKK